ncbi:MAG TPA: 50S ribosomal protein L10 [Thermoplasmata archaeon]|nr:50S ribosomal protein L10 [Thermoplasmata archaeon]
MVGRGSVPPARLERVEELSATILARPVTALVGVRGVPAAALQRMRRELRRKNRPIVVATNTAILHALERAGKERPALQPLVAEVHDQTALLAADGNPFALYQEFLKTRSPTPARGGEVAPADILVPAQTTAFKPGPIVGELQHAGFPAMIEKGKVVLKKDTLIVKAGQVISREVAGMLTRLEIFPLEVGLSLRAVVEGGTFYPASVLAVDLDAQRAQFGRAAQLALGLAVEIGYATPASLPLLVSRAHRRALAVAIATGYPTSETITPLFAQAIRAAAALGKVTGTSQGPPATKE